ncbi:2-(1,2-epoxy-1,2-dihydrophenyl)acetyl-CoA isomerase [Iodidimonas gelatinilytica]|uniref:2-(1,2-epoxy-1,2-dihydrophenyl)acetyl-CoA isomerase n=1 Tax=Iodidimonas gelatinilytica TaxID=1236966 RepID=A0A5A7MP21_9PROT|nr:enoyl-CoA hydratase-related protein [Iodidimonas gelatinilytica]GEQ96903.1 2-(1,2-epoxy-1,2-dihydrophenyl)acetyl-CoA isomerase [Iodidimonas gelatinilytica]
MSYRSISLEKENQIARLTLNQPERLNALSADLLAELATALDDLSSHSQATRCLIVTGAGRAFSSGADLSEKPTSGSGLPDLSISLRERYNPVVKKLMALPIPVIAAVNGPAAGAGMSLALCADFVLAARSAYFLQAFVNIGLAPDAGASWILPRLIGPARARRLMMLGEKLPATTAENWGLIHKAVEDDQLMDEVNILAQGLATGPTIAYGGIRALVRASLENGLDDQLELEAETQKRLGFTQDFMEGVRAFLTKSAATFTGK